MRILLTLILCMGLVGCDTTIPKDKEIVIPQKNVPLAEKNVVYDANGFYTLHIPRNCRAVGIAKREQILIENSSGTQFIFDTGGTAYFDCPARIIPDMPELW